MRIKYKGVDAEIEKKDFYCKAGAYRHKYRTGWVLVINGVAVLGDSIAPKSSCYGAARHDFPEFSTRKELIECVVAENENRGIER